MRTSNRYRWATLLSLALVAAGAALPGCGADPEEGEGQGRCGDLICQQGTSCNLELERCECTQSPDSCQPFGMVCNSVKVCIKEGSSGTEAKEWEKCNTVGEKGASGTLECIGPLPDGSNQWLRPCETSRDCRDRGTVCLRESSQGALAGCWHNFCGDDHVELDRDGSPVLDEGGLRHHLNGENWGRCDTETGRLSEGTPAMGACLPEFRGSRSFFLCWESGGLVEGEVCRPGVQRSSAALCAQGLQCEIPTVVSHQCLEHEDCDSTQWCDRKRCDPLREKCPETFCTPRPCSGEENNECGDGNYCDAGRCAKGGRCSEICDAVGDARFMGEFSSCADDSKGDRCTGGISSDLSAFDTLLAFCKPSCDLFSGAGCLPGLEACQPAASAENPLGGSCVAAGERREVGLGERCGPREICESGTTCRLSQCLALCDCAEGWDEGGQCLGESPRCEEEEICTMLYTDNERLGGCVPPPEP